MKRTPAGITSGTMAIQSGMLTAEPPIGVAEAGQRRTEYEPAVETDTTGCGGTGALGQRMMSTPPEARQM